MDFSSPLCYSGEKSVKKQELRQRILQKLRRQPEKARVAKSCAIGRALRRLKIYRKAKVILCYVAIDGEVETRPLLARALGDGKCVAVPVTHRAGRRIVALEIKDPDRDLKKVGPFRIPEPSRGSRRTLRPDEMDLIIVPGVAFDRKGWRLGRGGGYFDRFLEKVPPRIPRVGLAFRFQVLKTLPCEEHDQPVSRVLTD